MEKTVLLMILGNVLMTSFAQVSLKAGMSTPGVLDSLSHGFGWTALVSMLWNPLVLAGFGLYFGASLVWLLVLARIDVSLAYPFVGLGFVFTMLLAWWLHGEMLSPSRVLATLLITGGVVLLARS